MLQEIKKEPRGMGTPVAAQSTKTVSSNAFGYSLYPSTNRRAHASWKILALQFQTT
jgi:hypothetical protein